MGERADRRFAAVVGLILGLTAFLGDLALTPPPFIKDEVRTVIRKVNGQDPPTTRPGPGVTTIRVGDVSVTTVAPAQ